MKIKKLKNKTSLFLALLLVIGISSTACNKSLRPTTAEPTENIVKDGADTANKNSDVKLSEDKKSDTVVDIKKVSSGTVSQQSTALTSNPDAAQPKQETSSTPVAQQDQVSVQEPEKKTEQPQATQPSTQPEPVQNPTAAPSNPTDPLAPPVRTENNQTGEKVINYASTLLGVKYRFGGTSPVDSNPEDAIDDSGFDDSGFVQYVFAYFNISVGRTKSAQIKVGTEVTKDQLSKGDIVFFGKGGTASHVGIYSGNGTYIHAPGPVEGVRISPFNRTDFMTARRVIK
jgi:peptidoglycan DL-endopeptidase CwlO